MFGLKLGRVSFQAEGIKFCRKWKGQKVHLSVGSRRTNARGAVKAVAAPEREASKKKVIPPG